LILLSQLITLPSLQMRHICFPLLAFGFDVNGEGFYKYFDKKFAW